MIKLLGGGSTAQRYAGATHPTSNLGVRQGSATKNDYRATKHSDFLTDSFCHV